MYNIIDLVCTEVSILTKRFVVDRIEGDFAVLVSDTDKSRLDIPVSLYPLKVNDVADVTIEDGKPVAVTVVEGEAKRRLEENKSKLHSLFSKGRK